MSKNGLRLVINFGHKRLQVGRMAMLNGDGPFLIIFFADIQLTRLQGI
jgi:hypothetical protein